MSPASSALRVLLALLLIAQGLGSAVAGLHLPASDARSMSKSRATTTMAGMDHAAMPSGKHGDANASSPCHDAAEAAPTTAPAVDAGDAAPCCERDCALSCMAHAACALTLDWRARVLPTAAPRGSPSSMAAAPVPSQPIRPPIDALAAA